MIDIFCSFRCLLTGYRFKNLSKTHLDLNVKMDNLSRLALLLKLNQDFLSTLKILRIRWSSFSVSITYNFLPAVQFETEGTHFPDF